MTYTLGIDIGTTNCKVGVCDADYHLVTLLSIPTPTAVDKENVEVYSAQGFAKQMIALIKEAVEKYQPHKIAISSMAEAGVLIDRNTGELLSEIIPWRDMRSERCVSDMDKQNDEKRFYDTGLHVAYKYSIYKILAMQMSPDVLKNACFLSAASYLAYLLTGKMGIDPTLAARTYAFNIYQVSFERDFLKNKQLEETIFPPVLKNNYVGCLSDSSKQRIGADKNINVYIAGHDHVCASLAAGISKDNQELFLSLGTTGAVLGCFEKRKLEQKDYSTGFAYGLYPFENQMTWLGAIQSAGASISWGMRLTKMDFGTNEWPTAPTGILYFPYIDGSGPPQFESKARGAFIGLAQHHTDRDLLAAINEGIAFEIRHIIECALSKKPDKVKAVGGCTQNRHLMRTLANVLNCKIAVPQCKEATLIGAAMIADGQYTKKLEIGNEYISEPANAKKFDELYKSYLMFQKHIIDYRSK